MKAMLFFQGLMLLIAFMFMSMSPIVVGQYTVKSLPGFAGDLPFKLETGYISVGELDEVKLFYVFIESERSPKYDPLILWLTGGPGCSCFSALLYEIGPLKFNYEDSVGNKPILEYRQYSWIKIANIIFLDEPAGTGFSYATNWEGYNSSCTIQAAQNYEFLQKWLIAHPQFLNNQLFIGGDSYTGSYIPSIVEKITNGNRVGRGPPMNIQGYIMGNPFTDKEKDTNARVEFSFLKGLISQQLYESMKKNCNGDYVNLNLSNARCTNDVRKYLLCVRDITTGHILEPSCRYTSPKPVEIELETDDSLFATDIELLDLRKKSRPWCRSYNYIFSYIWLNDKSVQNALHVNEGSVENWERCNQSVASNSITDIKSSVPIQRDLIKDGYRVLVYSGDHDLVIPYVGTLSWILSLNLTIGEDWRPWFVDGQVAGYTMKFTESNYELTYATVKGAGHTAPEYKPEECFAMVERWLGTFSL